jgi:hypothetical protein
MTRLEDRAELYAADSDWSNHDDIESSLPAPTWHWGFGESRGVDASVA